MFIYSYSWLIIKTHHNILSCAVIVLSYDSIGFYKMMHALT